MYTTNRFPHWLIAGQAFLLSLLITWWFIREATLYTNTAQQLLSCTIAGAKWMVHIAAALLLLGDKAGFFIRQIANTCLTGSLFLLPYCLLSWLAGIRNNTFFLASLIGAVAVMIVVYAIGVKRAALPLRWWLAWLCTLLIAILSQLHFVFHVW